MNQDGSAEGYQTFIAWTDKGKEILDNFIQSENLATASVSEETLNEKIHAITNRPIIDHPRSTRDMILANILQKGSNTISQLKVDLGIPIKDVRYHTLRLAQIKKLSMVLGKDEPIFSPFIED